MAKPIQSPNYAITFPRKLELRAFIDNDKNSTPISKELSPQEHTSYLNGERRAGITKAAFLFMALLTSRTNINAQTQQDVPFTPRTQPTEITHKDKYTSEQISKEAEIASQRNDAQQHTYDLNKLIEKVNGPNDCSRILHKLKGFNKRQEFLQILLKNLNKDLQPAVEEFNKRHLYSLECFGIKEQTSSFVFINTFKNENIEPIRISVSYSEVKNTESKEKLVQLLEKKLTKVKDRFKNQYTTWSEQFDYDLPKDGSAACMIVCVPHKLTGVEAAHTRTLEIYQKYYKMSVFALCMENKKSWKEEVKNKGLSDLPEPGSASRDEILNALDISLKKVINEKKSTFVFHYMMHGSKKGSMGAADQLMSPKDFAKVISKYSDKIKIVTIMRSCYAGRQLDKIVSYLKHTNKPVKELIIISSAKHTSGYAGLSQKNASLVCDKLEKGCGPLDYYTSYYHELLEYLKSNEGGSVKFKSPVGTKLHEIRFADLMGIYDSKYGQDSLFLRYSNDPTNHQRIEKYYSKLFTLLKSDPVL